MYLASSKQIGNALIVLSLLVSFNSLSSFNICLNRSSENVPLTRMASCSIIHLKKHLKLGAFSNPFLLKSTSRSLLHFSTLSLEPGIFGNNIHLQMPILKCSITYHFHEVTTFCGCEYDCKGKHKYSNACHIAE